MAEEIKKILTVDTDKSAKNVKNLKKDIKDLHKTLEELEIGTKEYNQTLALLAKRQSELREINQVIARNSRTQIQNYQALRGITSGLAAGYSAANAAISVFGKNSEDLDKTMAKLQGTIALVQGVSGLGGLIKELPTLGDWFKRILDWINPLSKGLNDAATNLNNIDLQRLNALSDIQKGGDTSIKVTGDAGNWANPANPKFSANVDKSTGATAAFVQKQNDLKETLKVANKAYATQTQLISDLTMLRTIAQGQLDDITRREAALNQQYRAGQVDQIHYNLETTRLTNQRRVASQAVTDYDRRIQAATRNQRLATQAIQETASALQAMGQATTFAGKAWKGLMSVMKIAGWIAIVTAITAVISKVWDYISSLKSAAKEQYEFRKAIWESTNQIASKSLGVFKELQVAYEKIGDSAKEKAKFLEEYSDKIKETGLNLRTVNDLDDAFIKNTSKYVDAIMARAKAQAIENQAIKMYEEYLNKKSELEEKLSSGEAEKPTWIQQLGMFGGPWGPVIEVDKALEGIAQENRKKVEDELDKLNEEVPAKIRKMFEDVADLQNQYGGFFRVDVVKEDAKQVKEVVSELDQWLENYRVSLLTPEEKLKEEYDRLRELAKDNADALLKIDEWYLGERQKLEDEANKKAADERAKAYEDSLKRIRALNSTSNLREPQEQTFQTDYQQNFAKGFGLSGQFTYQSREDLQNQFEAQLEYNNQLFELTKSRIEQENALMQERLNDEAISADERLTIERELASNMIALSDATLAKDKANTNARIALEKAKQQALQATLSVGSSIAGSMAQIFGEETAAGKAFAIAQALMDTYAAANSAYSSMAGIPIVGPGLGAAAAAAAIVAGIANVKQILSVKTDGSMNSVSSGVSTAPPSLTAPPVQYTRNLLGDKETEVLNEPVKCYVVESDITEVQTKVAVTESNASF